MTAVVIKCQKCGKVAETQYPDESWVADAMEKHEKYLRSSHRLECNGQVSRTARPA